MNENELIRLSGVVKSFDDDIILKSLDLSVNDGEFVTLLGPSGCGKTTTLRIIGGFEKPDAGDVFFASQRINDVPPNKRNINTVFQKYALFPHLNVEENIAFGLNIRKVDKRDCPTSGRNAGTGKSERFWQAVSRITFRRAAAESGYRQGGDSAAEGSPSG